MSPAPSRSGRIAAAAVLILAIGYSWGREARFWGLDFAQLWVGGGTARVNRGDIYGGQGLSISNAYLAGAFERQQRSTALLNVLREREYLSRQPGQEWLAAFVSTPFLYLTFSVFPSAYDPAWLLFRILSMAATVAACLLLLRMAALSTPVSFLLAAAVLVLFEPLASDQRVGNVNRLQLLAVAVYLRLASTMRTGTLISGGFVLGLAIAFKPNVALIAPLVLSFRLIRRRFREAAMEAAGVAGGVLAAVFASSLFFGNLSAWTRWIEVAGKLARAVTPRALGNIAVLQAPALGAAVLFAVAAVAMWKSRNREGGDELLLPLAASLGPIIYLLSARVVWLHYAVLALPTAILLLGPRHPNSVRIAAASALIVIATSPLAPLFAVRDISVQTPMINLGLLLLFGLVMYRLTLRETGSRSPR